VRCGPSASDVGLIVRVLDAMHVTVALDWSCPTAGSGLQSSTWHAVVRSVQPLGLFAKPTGLNYCLF
jgi:hypothetical protein